MWVIAGWGALLLILTVAALIGAALEWIADGWHIEPLRDRHDDADPLIET